MIEGMLGRAPCQKDPPDPGADRSGHPCDRCHKGALDCDRELLGLFRREKDSLSHRRNKMDLLAQDPAATDNLTEDSEKDKPQESWYVPRSSKKPSPASSPSVHSRGRGSCPQGKQIATHIAHESWTRYRASVWFRTLLKWETRSSSHSDRQGTPRAGLIFPSKEVIRDILDSRCTAVCIREANVTATIENCEEPSGHGDHGQSSGLCLCAEGCSC